MDSWDLDNPFKYPSKDLYIEVGQSYFMVEVNHVDGKHFDMNLAKISPCNPVESEVKPHENALYFLNLHPTHGFIQDLEIMGDCDVEEGTIPPTGWEMDNH